MYVVILCMMDKCDMRCKVCILLYCEWCMSVIWIVNHVRCYIVTNGMWWETCIIFVIMLWWKLN